MADLNIKLPKAEFAPHALRFLDARQQGKFWGEFAYRALLEKDDDLSRGLDAGGRPFAALAERTIANRRSAMGPASPHAPPLTPAGGLSRTRSYLKVRVERDQVVLYWAFDPITGRRWASILDYHRRGAGALPVRDVFGLSPSAKRNLRSWAEARVRAMLRGSASYIPGVAARPAAGRVARPERPQLTHRRVEYTHLDRHVGTGTGRGPITRDSGFGRLE